MKKAMIAAIGLIAVHAATELWQLVYVLWPKSESAKVNLFLDQKAMPDGIPLLWWIKMLTDEVLWCYVFYDYAMTALKTNRKKFFVIFTFFIYHLIDAAMFLFNYKQWGYFYLLLLALDVVALVIIFLPVKEKAKVINI